MGVTCVAGVLSLMGFRFSIWILFHKWHFCVKELLLLFFFVIFLKEFIFYSCYMCCFFMHFIKFLNLSKFVQHLIVFFCCESDKFQGTYLDVCQVDWYVTAKCSLCNVSVFVFQGFNGIFAYIPNSCFFFF